jgi:DNA polymerase I
MKIRGVMARKGDTPEYVRRMHKELFDVVAKARSLDERREIEPLAQRVREKYMLELEGADVKELAIHRRASRMDYSRNCAEPSGRANISETRITHGSRQEIGLIIYNV